MDLLTNGCWTADSAVNDDLLSTFPSHVGRAVLEDAHLREAAARRAAAAVVGAAAAVGARADGRRDEPRALPPQRGRAAAAHRGRSGGGSQPIVTSR